MIQGHQLYSKNKLISEHCLQKASPLKGAGY